jgi:hypothetical protein
MYGFTRTSDGVLFKNTLGPLRVLLITLMYSFSVISITSFKKSSHRQGNLDLKKQVRHIGNYFTNSVETSAQEAIYLTLQIPLARATRRVVFINTSPPEKKDHYHLGACHFSVSI